MMAMASSSSSSSTWIFHSKPPKREISHFYLNESIRIKRRTQRLLIVKCSSSLHEEPPVVSKTKKEKVKIDEDLSLTVKSSTPLKGRRRRSPIDLWKRIFLASKKVRSIILLNVITVIYASDIPVLKEVEQIVDPAFFNVVRFTITAIPFVPFIVKAREDSQTRSAGIELGLWVSLGYLSQALGLLTSEAGQASFISAFTIIVVPLINGMFGATIPSLTWSGALLSLVGVGILEYGGSPPCVGDILNIMSAVFFGVHIFRTEQISRNTSKKKFLALLGYQVSVVALSSAFWFICRDIVSQLLQLDTGSGSGSGEWSSWWHWMVSFPWIPAIYTGIVSTALCLWAEMEAMRDVSATETAIIYGLEPVWGAAFAWFLLGERWGSTEWLGAALVLCGSLTIQLLGSTPEKSSNKKGDRSSNHRNSISSNDQKDFSLLTVVVKTKKNDDELFRKRDKL
ncbi:uncharacterized protein A4U43_C03F14210 [Asparagus officinalis]|uniref:EamA domain-containing protein n=1 Tax=Asparagus officinalis TaxID=4686 RepID=A0A5P1FEX0_ASPOF|nr:uncharacterized protein LOC109833673 [Asparagus officinalis]ONK75181.1 uncharacterized protein A4U43_C03F14210 [Asparagus officinalis]